MFLQKTLAAYELKYKTHRRLLRSSSICLVLDMPQILFIHSSAFSSEIRKENQGSYTRKMSRILRESIRGRGVRVVERDVASKPPGMIDQSFVIAARTPPADRTPEQAARLKESDELVSEVLASDVIVIACPVYNFGIPAPLKAWIDNIVREGRTYTYGEGRNAKRLYGLLHNKLVVILQSSGSTGLNPGGSREALNHADKAVIAVFSELGVHKFEMATVEGVCEGAEEMLSASWLMCERRLAEIADRIKARWRDMHRAG